MQILDDFVRPRFQLWEFHEQVDDAGFDSFRGGAFYALYVCPLQGCNQSIGSRWNIVCAMKRDPKTGAVVLVYQEPWSPECASSFLDSRRQLVSVHLTLTISGNVPDGY